LGSSADDGAVIGEGWRLAKLKMVGIGLLSVAILTFARFILTSGDASSAIAVADESSKVLKWLNTVP